MKFLLLIVVVTLAIAMVTRAGGAWRFLTILLVISLVYTALKLTGVVDSFDPRGMWGFLG